MGASYEDLDGGRERPALYRLVAFAASMGLFFTALSRARGEWGLEAVAGAVLEEDAASASGGGTTVEINVNYTSILGVGSVCAHIAKMEGLHDCLALDEDVLLKYVPRALKLTVDHDLVRSTIGEQASAGYLAFNMVWEDSDDSFFSSWFVVVSYAGEIVTMVPLRENGEVYRAAGFKPWNAEEFVFGAGRDTLLTGYAYKLDWTSGSYEKLSHVEINTHDIQKAFFLRGHF